MYKVKMEMQKICFRMPSLRVEREIRIMMDILQEKILRLYVKTYNMEILYEILKIVLPAALVLLTAWIILRNMIRNDQNKRRHELILQGARTVTPIRLQAYERIVLFLERISMESLLIRISTPDMTAGQLQTALLSAIRNEFEHNLSQQIYMSSQAWEVVKNARSNTIKIINSEAEKIKSDSPAIMFSKLLLEKVMELEKEPTRVAIDFIKSELSEIL